METTDSVETDETLMLRLQHGDESALAVLMQRWEIPLKRFIFRLIGNTSAATDIAQETFVRVYFKRATFRPGAKFSSWLFAIAANQAKNQLRWWRRRPALSLNEWVDRGGDIEDEAVAPNIPTYHGDRDERIHTQNQKLNRCYSKTELRRPLATDRISDALVKL